MNELAALREIRRVARTGLLVLTTHAQHRMEERRVSTDDVRLALLHASRVSKSRRDHASDWTVTGRDTDGDELTLGVILRGGIVVVTVH